MSGIYKPMIIGFGLASSIIAILVVRRMDRIDGARMTLHVAPLRFARYLVWLMVEIFRANWAVAKVILSPDMPINQTFLKVPYSQKSPVGRTIFANSITLTPGTISVEVEDGQFLVHALAYQDGDLDALADMNARVAATESEGAA